MPEMNVGKIDATIKIIGAAVFIAIPFVWLIGILTSHDLPIPADVQGCYASGDQALDVRMSHIIINRARDVEVGVKFETTNVGRQIEAIGGSALKLDPAKPPFRQIGDNTVIFVQPDALEAFTDNGQAIVFRKQYPNGRSQGTCARKLPDR